MNDMRSSCEGLISAWGLRHAQRRLLPAFALATTLVACGGGSVAPDRAASQAHPAFAEGGPAHPALTSRSVSPTSVHHVGAPFFDWAEAHFPELFPSSAPTHQSNGFAFRHYPGTGNYVGVADDAASVYVLGPPTANEVIRVGALSDFVCLVSPWLCAPAPPPQTFVADINGVPLKAPQPAVFEPGNTFTLEGWIYLSEREPRAWIAGKALPIAGGAGGMTLVYGMALDDQGERLRFFVGPTAELRSPAALPLRGWTHVAAVLDRNEARLFVNGQLVASRADAPAVPPAPTLPLGLGAPYGADGLPASQGGTLHARHWRYWRAARSGAQIAAAMPYALPQQQSGLVAAWPLDERNGAQARDAVGTLALTRSETSIGTARRVVLESGPFFEARRVEMAAGTMTDPSDLALIDFDSNGWLDLFVAQVAWPPTYPATHRSQLAFRNQEGRLVEASSSVLGGLLMVNPRRLIVGDFDHDGRSDLLIAETGTDTFPVPGGQSRLLLQNANGRLIDRSAQKLALRDEYTHGLAVADVDGDGDLDAFMGNYQPFPLRLLINDGTGALADQGSSRLPSSLTNGTRTAGAVALCDLTGDGRPELIIGGDYYALTGPTSNRPNELFINDGRGHFALDPRLALPPKLHGSAGLTPEIACADLNGDGRMDLLLATDNNATVPGLQLLLNDGGGRMRDASAQLNVRFSSTDAWVAAIHVTDINHDGKPDLVLRTISRNYGPRNYARTILLNRGGANFVDASEAFNVNAASGIAVGDIDRDGRSDIVTANGRDSLIVWRALKPLDLSLFND